MSIDYSEYGYKKEKQSNQVDYAKYGYSEKPKEENINSFTALLKN